MIDRRNLGSSERNSLPGDRFASQYAAIYHEVGGDLRYSTVESKEELEDELQEGGIVAVRVNKPELPETPDYLESDIAVSRHTGDARAVLYGEVGQLVRSSEEFLEPGHELFENPEEALEQEVT